MKGTLKIKVLVSIITIIMILAIANISRAYSVNGSLLTLDKLIAGGDVDISFSLSDIDMADGVRSITIEKVDYDSTVFENITSSSFVGSSGWSASYNAENGKATLINMNPVTENGIVVTLKLKVRSGVTVPSTEVRLQTIVASSGTQTTGNIPVGTKKVTLYADAPAEYGSVTDQDPEPEPQPQTPQKNNTIDTIQPQKTENKTNTNTTVITASKSDKKILKAGDETTIILAVVGVTVFTIAVVGFVKYVKNRDI